MCPMDYLNTVDDFLFKHLTAKFVQQILRDYKRNTEGREYCHCNDCIFNGLYLLALWPFEHGHFLFLTFISVHFSLNPLNSFSGAGGWLSAVYKTTLTALVEEMGGEYYLSCKQPVFASLSREFKLRNFLITVLFLMQSPAQIFPAKLPICINSLISITFLLPL